MKPTVLSLIVWLSVGCDSYNEDSTPCGRPDGSFFEGISAKVYSFSPQGKESFGFAFYLGTPTGRSFGGAIPCSILQKEFQVEGLDVIWSGFDKGSRNCTEDPAFWYVILTSIEKAY